MSWIDPSPTGVTVAQLVHREVSLDWPETVAVVLEIAETLDRSPHAWLPSYQDIALTPEGEVEFRRESANTTNPLTTLADIFRALLPTDAPQSVWDVASAAGPESASYDSVPRLAGALTEFDPPNRRAVLAGVCRRALEQRELEAALTQEPPAEPTTGLGVDAGEVRMLPVDSVRQRVLPQPEVPMALVALVRRHGVLPTLLVRAGREDYEVLWGSAWLNAAKVAGFTRVPCQVCEVDDEDAKTLVKLEAPEPPATAAGADVGADQALVVGATLVEVSDSLDAAVSCWGLTARGADRPYHEAVREITQIEMQRATWLVNGLRVLAAPVEVTKTPRNVGILLERVFQATQAERRQIHVRLLANLSQASVMVAADEHLVVQALTGAVSAMLSLVRGVPQAMVKCEVLTSEVGVDVAFFQELVPVLPGLLGRFFDPGFAERRGGHTAAVGLGVAARVLELHGGLTKVQALEPVGCRMTLHFPSSRG